MKSPNACLVFVFPASMEENVVDHFSKPSASIHGFTLSHVEGYSARRGFHSLAEQIHGRGPRVHVQLLVDRADVAEIIAGLKAEGPTRDVAYWVMPVDEFGTLD